ncbi:hypothetical protein LAV84_28045 [Rhizobium sp. VS19-DR104.2]|uniref:hypothetical protein n=1 Tax=unclassified Rhizobium TaxID=2613769 RepID=UPI001C5B7A71|nr:MULTISPECIES: hypothetical protein [unclassified Rhizobium]MBZ5763371.1 hypothetical protein [Rhizobium sp. VS19-DR96]MBZ5769259.1 hypothetical protein [Rhizobium sp. VS19-DR129.2]MBZ5776805.1 hypothetical protein [Rhizobium sp. VS19-DRK62.2]MBZ5787890.1 hypothetical protein [Rhizobium sp. VS19-DR121]MBZ5805391.1 hypothetical protein [Rhizobium sp. VS19-DR181]
MGKEIWFFHRLGPIEIVAATIAISGTATIAGIWVTTAAKFVYAHPMDNLAYTFLVLALYLLFNAVLVGLCCAAALSILKAVYAASSTGLRLIRTALIQPILLVRALTAFVRALFDKSAALRRRLTRSTSS